MDIDIAGYSHTKEPFFTLFDLLSPLGQFSLLRLLGLFNHVSFGYFKSVERKGSFDFLYSFLAFHMFRSETKKTKKTKKTQKTQMT